MYVCMGSLYRCIVDCAYLGNCPCHRTVPKAVPLLLSSGPVKYEAVLPSCGTIPVGGGRVSEDF